MKEFTEALKASAVTIVTNASSAAAVNSGSLPVFATPMMIALMEQATCNACKPLLEEDETTVGTKISVTHDKASKIGSIITANATLTEVDGRRLIFSVEAIDENKSIIGKGEIERFVVLSDKFMKKVNAK